MFKKQLDLYSYKYACHIHDLIVGKHKHFSENISITFLYGILFTSNFRIYYIVPKVTPLTSMWGLKNSHCGRSPDKR